MKTFIETAMIQAKIDKMFDAVWCAHNHRIELPWDEAMHYIRRIEAYNNFEWAKVQTAMSLIDQMIPPCDYGKDNPNTGSRNYKIEIGRANSPVIYLKRYEFDHGTGTNQPPLTDLVCRAICSVMLEVAEADESTYTLRTEDEGQIRIAEFRFWFD